MPEDERLLLKACLAEPQDFEKALRDWESKTEISNLNAGLTRLLPYLYVRSKRLGITLAEKSIIKGVYRKFWVQRALMEQRAKLGLRDLCESETPVLLKGAALVEKLYQEDKVSRPYEDIDILVPRGVFLFEINKLPQLGWQAERGLLTEVTPGLSHGASFAKDGASVDIHWLMFPFNLDSKYEERVRTRSQKIAKLGREFLLPTDTDLLLHTLVHGHQENHVSPARWVLDAALLIRAADIDWDLFTSEATACGWSGVTKKALQVLRAEYEVAEIPTEVLKPPRFNPKSIVSIMVFVGYRTNSVWLRRFIRFAVTNYFTHRAARQLDGQNTKFLVVWLGSIRLGLLALSSALRRLGLRGLVRSKDWASPMSDGRKIGKSN